VKVARVGPIEGESLDTAGVGRERGEASKMAAEEIVCTVCGATNAATLQRCSSCGAKLEALGAVELTAEEAFARRNQQDTFEWKWVFIAFAIFITLGGLFLGALPFVIPNFDPQGLPGLLITTGLWFAGGIVIGILSPGKTFIEPAVGALMAVVPTLMWLAHIADYAQLSTLAYIVGGMIGVMVTLLGAFLGERLQVSAQS
jgi:hypothetical protein